MTSFDFPFSFAETMFIVCYVASLVFIGWLGMRAQKEKTMKDFYLGGRGIGFGVLLLTLYATQYSGNTLFGFTGKAYRVGLQWLVCVHFMTAIVVVYMAFAPKLYKLAKEHTFITPSDFLSYRFGHRGLSSFASVVMILGLANYLLAQLKALGEAASGFLPDYPKEAYVGGVIALAFIIVLYESLGGFRAVAWTDVIQGLVLMFGFGILVWLVFRQFGSLDEAIGILQSRPNGQAMTAPPKGGQIAEWVSWVLIVGLGGALYPQAIQRIYAAKSAPVLRKSLAVMAFLPLTTTLIAVVFGVMAAAHVELQGSGDSVLTTVCRMVQLQSQAARWLVVVLFAGVLAALMSTADSVLLSISSMFTKDLYAGVFSPQANQRQLTLVGKSCSWIVIVMMTIAAIVLRDTSLVAILKIKFELLVQLAPAFVIGIHWQRMNANWTFAGMVCGVAVALLITFTTTLSGTGNLLGIHAGLYGLAANLLTSLGGSLLTPCSNRTEAESAV